MQRAPPQCPNRSHIEDKVQLVIDSTTTVSPSTRRPMAYVFNPSFSVLKVGDGDNEWLALCIAHIICRVGQILDQKFGHAINN